MAQLVGILNVTPDSFSDGGAHFAPEAAIQHAELLFADGADIIDVGAESTKPGAIKLTPEQEWRRLEPVLQELLPAYPDKISLDSYHPETIERAFSIGSVIVNDVTGMNNPDMVAVVSKFGPRVIVSHLPGVNIQKAHREAPVSTVEEVKQDLLAKAHELQDNGLDLKQVILDPGIGFGKTATLNQELIAFAKQVPEFDVMVGYSRKRFLGEYRMQLGPNLAAGQIAVASGAKYLRVHDVAGHQTLLKQ